MSIGEQVDITVIIYLSLIIVIFGLQLTTQLISNKWSHLSYYNKKVKFLSNQSDNIIKVPQRWKTIKKYKGVKEKNLYKRHK